MHSGLFPDRVGVEIGHSVCSVRNPPVWLLDVAAVEGRRSDVCVVCVVCITHPTYETTVSSHPPSKMWLNGGGPDGADQ